MKQTHFDIRTSRGYQIGEFFEHHYKGFLAWWSVGLLVSGAVLVPVARAHWQVPMEPKYYRAAVFAAEGYCLASGLGGLSVIGGVALGYTAYKAWVDDSESAKNQALGRAERNIGHKPSELGIER